MTEHVDVLIVGAGLSGIGAAHHLQAAFPRRTYAILEARDALGGTWDLFRYPGVRSDSDMHTLGYRFRPWTQDKAITDGPSILRYVRDAATEAGIDKHIRYGHRVQRAAWSTEDARWTVDATADGVPVRLTASFLFVCSGYYHYDIGHTPSFPGIERFNGIVIHPQQWPEDLDYAGKKIVVIGSGATAVTLVPALTDRAGHVTMLQRSPTYIAARPARDQLGAKLTRRLGTRGGYAVTRWKNVALGTWFYQLSRRRPDAVKSMLRQAAIAQLPPGYDVDTHFTPSYNPWDQRMCLAPDGDFFAAIRSGAASVVTDQIAEFTETGIRLESGAELGADIEIDSGYVIARTKNGLRGGEIVFPKVTVGGTHTALMAASLARGTTVIENAAQEPEIKDLADCLNKMGARITGAGTSRIVVEGVAKLKGARHAVLPDRIETGTYAMAVAMAGGDILLQNARPELLQAALDVLTQAGATVTSTNEGIRVARNGAGIAPVDVTTAPFPQFPTDLQAQLMALMTRAGGTSQITETIFENRFMHVQELARLGARIQLDGERATIEGVPELKGAPVMATDLRASVSLVIAGLAAEGETIVNRVYHLDRGFERLEEKLSRCGAAIERLSG